MLLLRENILEKLFCRTTDFNTCKRNGNAIFDCINDSNVRFIKDIMLILYRKVWNEDLDLLVIFILVVKVTHVELKIKSSIFSARTRRSHSCNEYLEFMVFK